MKRYLMSVVTLALVLAGANSAMAAQPVARVTKVTQEHNVTVNGKKGVLLHVELTVDHGRGQPCLVLVGFVDRYGNPIQGQEGPLLLTGEFVPQSDRIVLRDTLFLPYEEIDLGAGKHAITFRLGVFTGPAQNPLLLAVYEGWFTLTR